MRGKGRGTLGRSQLIEGGRERRMNENVEEGNNNSMLAAGLRRRVTEGSNTLQKIEWTRERTNPSIPRLRFESYLSRGRVSCEMTYAWISMREPNALNINNWAVLFLRFRKISWPYVMLLHSIHFFFELWTKKMMKERSYKSRLLWHISCSLENNNDLNVRSQWFHNVYYSEKRVVSMTYHARILSETESPPLIP